MKRALFLAPAWVGFCLATPPAAHAGLTPPDEANAEQVESRCTINAQEYGLTGKAFDDAVTACVTQESPYLGFWEHCRAQGRKQNRQGVALQSFVAHCLANAP